MAKPAAFLFFNRQQRCLMDSNRKTKKKEKKRVGLGVRAYPQYIHNNNKEDF